VLSQRALPLNTASFPMIFSNAWFKSRPLLQNPNHPKWLVHTYATYLHSSYAWEPKAKRFRVDVWESAVTAV